MEYRKILEEREKQRTKIEDLKNERDLCDGKVYLNKEIQKNKFKYNFYNQLLKKGDKNENKN